MDTAGPTPRCAHCGKPIVDDAVAGSGGEMFHRVCTQPLAPLPSMPPKPENWTDPKCPKCGLTLLNSMMYSCGNQPCPVGL